MVGDLIVYTEETDGTVTVVFGSQESGVDIWGLLPAGLGGLGGWWDSLKAAFSKIGDVAQKVAVVVTGVATAVGSIVAYLKTPAGSGIASGCVLDRTCGRYFRLVSAATATATFAEAPAGYCTGRAIYDSASIPGWATPPGCVAPGTVYAGGTVSGTLGTTATTWLWIGAAVLAVVVILSVAKGGRR